MTKDEALNKIIEYYKNGSKTPVSDFCRIPCSVCPFVGDYCEHDIADSLIERLVKAEEHQETNFDHYYDGKLAFDDFVNTGEEKLIADVYTLCFKTGTDEVYKKSGIRDFKRWLLSPYEEPPKYKLSKFEYDSLCSYDEMDKGVRFDRYYPLKAMKKKGYFKELPDNANISYIVENCEVVD